MYCLFSGRKEVNGHRAIRDWVQLHTHTQIHTNNLSCLSGEHVFAVGGKNVLS